MVTNFDMNVYGPSTHVIAGIALTLTATTGPETWTFLRPFNTRSQVEMYVSQTNQQITVGLCSKSCRMELTHAPTHASHIHPLHKSDHMAPDRLESMDP